jgi:hypothetical protein
MGFEALERLRFWAMMTRRETYAKPSAQHQMSSSDLGFDVFETIIEG